MASLPPHQNPGGREAGAFLPGGENPVPVRRTGCKPPEPGPRRQYRSRGRAGAPAGGRFPAAGGALGSGPPRGPAWFPWSGPTGFPAGRFSGSTEPWWAKPRSGPWRRAGGTLCFPLRKRCTSR